jgi:N-acetylglucosamine malate deacetylase 2
MRRRPVGPARGDPAGLPGRRPVRVPVDTLASHLEGARPDLLLVFDEDGISGHPDHRRATEVALDWGRRRGVPVLAWAVSPTVANRLNSEFGTRFAGRAEVDFIVRVARTAQREAIDCHQSQAKANPVLWRRLELMGNEERLRWISR